MARDPYNLNEILKILFKVNLDGLVEDWKRDFPNYHFHLRTKSDKG